MRSPALQSNVILRTDNVSCRFGEVLALSGVSLAVEPGRLFGLVGPDGAGKTTLIRALSGLLKVESGHIEVFGKDPLRDDELRDCLGVMPQHYSLYGDLSVEENLRFFADLYCLSKPDYQERRERLLALTRLADFTERRADALSGGMYKKLALACALLHEPDILLLDEPTNGVDPVSRRELWQLLQEFVSTGMTVVISTAYMDEAERCHKVCLLHQGRVLTQGTPRQLMTDLRAVVIEISGGVRDVLQRQLTEAPEVIALSPAGTRLRVILQREGLSTIDAALRRLQVTFEPVTPNFEDVFLVHTHLGESKDRVLS
jgi:ABC-2 type transport system ATP-binding protein